jgi:hypothetical protein
MQEVGAKNNVHLLGSTLKKKQSGQIKSKTAIHSFGNTIGSATAMAMELQAANLKLRSLKPGMQSSQKDI